MQADDVLQAVRTAGGVFAEATPAQTIEELKADSLDRVELAMALEGQFSIVIEDATVEAWGATETTIGSIIDHVLAKVGKT